MGHMKQLTVETLLPWRLCLLRHWELVSGCVCLWIHANFDLCCDRIFLLEGSGNPFSCVLNQGFFHFMIGNCCFFLRICFGFVGGFVLSVPFSSLFVRGFSFSSPETCLFSMRLTQYHWIFSHHLLTVFLWTLPMLTLSSFGNIRCQCRADTWWTLWTRVSCRRRLSRLPWLRRVGTLVRGRLPFVLYLLYHPASH